MIVSDIEWDVDEPEDLEDLPDALEVPDMLTDPDEISDYITQQTGFCHKGFFVERTGDLTVIL